MKFKFSKKLFLITGAIGFGVFAGVTAYRAYKNGKIKKVQLNDDDKLFTDDIEEYLDPWEVDHVTDACKRIMKQEGDKGPFTVDLEESVIDDEEVTDDFVIVHSKLHDYKITLSKTINMNDYIIL